MPPQPPIRGVFRTDERARAAYAEGAGIYRIVPRAVCRPADAEDVQALVRWAAEERMPLVPRGAGSAMGGGNVGDGVVVDLTALAPRTLVVDADRRTARAAAPVTLAQLNAAAAPAGLRLPPDPSSGRWATLAGMLSTNAAGARTVRYGSARAWVEAATVVTADGELGTFTRAPNAAVGARLRLAPYLPDPSTRSSFTGIEARRRRDRSVEGRGGASPLLRCIARFDETVAPAILAAADEIHARFPRTSKNSSGYALDAWLASRDPLDLIVGAEGTLGIVVESAWRLAPVLALEAGLRVVLRDADAIGDAVQALLPLGPSALELLDRSFLDLVRPTLAPGLADALAGAEAVLLVEFEGAEAGALHDLVTRAAKVARPWADSVEAATGGEAAARLWALRHAASPILASLPATQRSLQVVEDGCVPVARLAEYVRAVRRLSAARGIPAVLFGHAGDGHVHVNLLPELARPGWEREVALLLDEVTDALLALGGTPSGEHGDGRLRAPLLERVYGREVVELFGRVKAAFDPPGIFNPGVIVSDGGASIARLKTGAGAAPLPPDVAAALREIERTGGYARDRLTIADQIP